MVSFISKTHLDYVNPHHALLPLMLPLSPPEAGFARTEQPFSYFLKHRPGRTEKSNDCVASGGVVLQRPSPHNARVGGARYASLSKSLFVFMHKFALTSLDMNPSCTHFSVLSFVPPPHVCEHALQGPMTKV